MWRAGAVGGLTYRFTPPAGLRSPIHGMCARYGVRTTVRVQASLHLGLAISVRVSSELRCCGE